MAVTPEEKEEIICAAVERCLLSMPEVIGNLMANHAALHKMNSEFYKAHPEFRDHKDVVASVVESLEGSNPLMKYDELLNKSIPEIQRRIQILKTIDVDHPAKQLPRDFSGVDVSKNGQL